jgi:hypothetical protein
MRPGSIRAAPRAMFWPVVNFVTCEDVVSEGGSTPYPHIALCATAPKSISSRRTSRMPSDVQKRCLPPIAAAGPESSRGQNQA